jgi:exodeoxyribonuclease VII large subunit
MQARDKFTRLGIDTAFASLRENFARRQQRVDEMRFRIEAAWNVVNRSVSEQLHLLTARLRRQDTTHRLQLLRERLTSVEGCIVHLQQSRMRNDSVHLQNLMRQLHALSPLAVLNRGYALVFDEAGALVKNTANLTPNQCLVTRLAQGRVESRVTEIISESTT